jgi:membrane-bound lytic murein transglycosylase D
VLEAATDLALAAALAREPWDGYRARHAGHRDGTVAAGRAVLVRRAEVARFEQLVSRIPPARRTGWRRAPRSQIGPDAALDEALLALVNVDAAAGAWLAPAGKPPPRAPAVEVAAADARHTVRSGESLWVIARRYRVSVGALLEWNGLDARALLKPGDVLRIAAPR